MRPATSINEEYELRDRYLRQDGRIFLTGIQALTRLPIMQAMRDRAAGINTAGFVSGYRGSPLGGYDQELVRSREYLEKYNILFKNGLNEDLAATAVWGTQQTALFEGAKYDGVFGIWYGKGPGVDRSGDAFRHANAFGTSKYGGVLAVAGDDHGVQSSTIAHQSDHVFMGHAMPILNPSNVSEILELGLAGFELSRYSGCWIGFKTVTEVVESAASVVIDPMFRNFVTPDDFQMPPRGLNFDPTLRWPEERRELEVLQQSLRLDAARAWARANEINRVVWPCEKPRIGIITTGKAYQDVLHALKELRIDRAEAEQIGITIFKVGMSWPLEPQGIKAFTKGLEEVIVVEEKRSIVERQVKDILYHQPEGQRPRVIGKTDEDGKPGLSILGELTPRHVASVIMERVRKGPIGNAMDDKFVRILADAPELSTVAAPVARSPYFCSGCPHNTSTRVPEGSHAMGGIGCHIMALSMDRDTSLFTHMGAEGTNWIGLAPFTEVPHVFQNLGDGTYEHSGILAIRAAVHAGVNITYKILYNDAVAMTGGQPIAGQLTVPAIVNQVRAEGVDKIAIVSENDPASGLSHYHLSNVNWPGLSFHHRDDLDAVQKEFRDTEGVSLIVYDQTCAAEKRRRRKRGMMEDPALRVFINDEVCEGCGDCSVKSNCVSIEPLETDFGTKRKINQSSCNKDTSCLKGFCPSFVTVEGGAVRKPDPRRFDDEEHTLMARLPEPNIVEGQEAHYNILVGGIGGTGVVTVGALISMAAHLENKGVTTLDFTGLAQKNGAVISHIRIAEDPSGLDAVRIGELSADLLLGCDMVVAGSLDALTRCDTGRTHAIVNTHETPTADFTLDTSISLPAAATKRAIRNRIGDELTDFINVTSLATNLFGDAIATNLMILGYAFQKGLLPLSSTSIERAIELNQVAVQQNLKSFRWGRLLAHDPDAVNRRAFEDKVESLPLAQSLAEKNERRVSHLTKYQNKALADRFLKLVARVEEAEKKLGSDAGDLAEAVAASYFKVLAYKDEYEVARAYVDPTFMRKVRSEFAGDFKINFHLAPPLFAKRDPSTGHLRKSTFSGKATLPLFKMLAKARVLRGTPMDIFGYTEERKQERKLIEEFEGTVETLLATLSVDNRDLAVRVARLPMKIKGFGHVKEDNLKATREEWASLLKSYELNETVSLAAE